MACTCKVGPGKFEGEPALTFMAYQQAALGNADEIVGRYDFFKAPFGFDADAGVVEAARNYGYCDECIENYDDPDAYGLVVWTSDQGFASLDVYSTQEAFQQAIDDASAECDEEED